MMAAAAAESDAELQLEADLRQLDAQQLAAQQDDRCVPPPEDGIGLQEIVSEPEMLMLMDEVLERLKTHGTGRDEDHTADDVWLQTVTDLALPEDAFQAGNIQLHLPAFRAYWGAAGVLQRKQVKRLLNWLEDGMPIEFCEPDAACQQQHPRYLSRVRQVRQLLSHEVPADRIDGMLSGKQPQPIECRNRVSCQQHADVVAAQFSEMLKVGTVIVWRSEWGQPTVISGIGVVPKAGGKHRVIIDLRYLNLFIRYRPFHYEQLKDLKTYLRAGDMVASTDMRSGYHMQHMHPDTRRFLCVRFQGVIYCFTKMCFGLASACKAYTTLMGEILRPLRSGQLGQERLTTMIDDTQLAFSSKAQGKYRMRTMVLLYAALGFFLSLDKCSLLPKHQNKFLGLIVDAQHLTFIVPAEKVVRYKAAAAEFLQRQQCSARQVAQLAGLLLSFAPAVALAPLFTRELYNAIAGTQDWDAPFRLGGGARTEVQFLLDHIDELNGHHMFKREKAVIVVGDASETAYAGYTPNGELGSAINVAFSESELQQMKEGQYSSTLREAVGLCKVVTVLLEQLPPGVIATHRIQFVGDNQGCISVFQHMRGQPQIVEVMKELRVKAFKAQAEVDFVWQPRESAEIQVADALSKEMDTSDLVLCKAPSQRLMRSWGCPTVDVFATSVDGGHKTAKFFSKYYEPGCSGVDGLRQAWGDEFVWAFPPFHMVAATIKKIQEELVHCILIVPAEVCFWTPMLRELPVQDMVSMSFHAGLYRLTSRVPKEWHSNVPRHPLVAYHIRF